MPAFGLVAAQWASPSGDTLIGEWAISSNTGMTASPSANGNVAGNASSGETSSSASLTVTDPTAAGLGPAHIGVISHGKFMPLPASPRLHSRCPQSGASPGNPTRAADSAAAHATLIEYVAW